MTAPRSYAYKDPTYGDLQMTGPYADQALGNQDPNMTQAVGPVGGGGGGAAMPVGVTVGQKYQGAPMPAAADPHQQNLTVDKWGNVLTPTEAARVSEIAATRENRPYVAAHASPEWQAEHPQKGKAEEGQGTGNVVFPGQASAYPPVRAISTPARDVTLGGVHGPEYTQQMQEGEEGAYEASKEASLRQTAAEGHTKEVEASEALGQAGTLHELNRSAQEQRDTFEKGRKERETKIEQMFQQTPKDVDPDRMLGHGFTLGNILATVATSLGAYAAIKTHSPNFAADSINQAITRDIEAQKSNIAKRRGELEDQRSLLAMYMQGGASMEEAERATRASILNQAQLHTQAMVAQSQSEEVAAKGAATVAALELKKQEAITGKKQAAQGPTHWAHKEASTQYVGGAPGQIPLSAADQKKVDEYAAKAAEQHDKMASAEVALNNLKQHTKSGKVAGYTSLGQIPSKLTGLVSGEEGIRAQGALTNAVGAFGAMHGRYGPGSTEATEEQYGLGDQKSEARVVNAVGLMQKDIDAKRANMMAGIPPRYRQAVLQQLGPSVVAGSPKPVRETPE